MIPFSFTYATPSTFESTRTRALYELAVDLARPVRFHAKVVRDLLPLRFALQALGQLIWHSDEWFPDFFTLDPIVTVHPDRVFFEAFSADQSKRQEFQTGVLTRAESSRRWHPRARWALRELERGARERRRGAPGRRGAQRCGRGEW